MKSSFNDSIAYVIDSGIINSTPPGPGKRAVIDPETKLKQLPITSPKGLLTTSMNQRDPVLSAIPEPGRTFSFMPMIFMKQSKRTILLFLKFVRDPGLLDTNVKIL